MPGSSANPPPISQGNQAQREVVSDPSKFLEEDGPELVIVESEVPPISTDEEEDPLDLRGTTSDSKSGEEL